MGLALVTPMPNADLRSRKRDSPVGEVTTTSDYFASSGKSKPTRSTPVKPKAQPERKAAEEPKAPSAQSTPKAKATPKSEPATNGKSSSRKKSKPNYAVDLDDENSDFAPKVIKDDADSGEDIFVADYKTGRRGDVDAYESDDDEDDILQPSRKTTKGAKGAKGDSSKTHAK